jgi:prophage regulatory protein
MELAIIAPSETYSAPAFDRLLTMRELTRATSLSRTTVYRMVDEGTLPPPLKIGKSRIAWRASSIARWLAERQVAA